jgi:hypothetical protein
MYSRNKGSPLDQVFKAVTGQDENIENGVSFESTSVPGRFLRHWALDKVSLHATDTLNIE